MRTQNGREWVEILQLKYIGFATEITVDGCFPTKDMQTAAPHKWPS